jgi:hypothetical protein
VQETVVGFSEPRLRQTSTKSVIFRMLLREGHAVQLIGEGWGCWKKLVICVPKVHKFGYMYILFFPTAQQHLFGCLGLLIVRRFTITHIRHTTVGRTLLDE